MKSQTNSKARDIITKAVFLIAVLALWEIVAKSGVLGKRSNLIFPTLEAIGVAFISNFTVGFAGSSLWVYIGNSMRLLLEGLLIGIVLAFLFSGLSIISKTFNSIYNLMVSICDLLPGVALLPVVIIIFGRSRSTRSLELELLFP